MHNILIQKASELGLALDIDAAHSLLVFSSMLQEASKSYNLTAIVEPYDILIKHFVDSLSAHDLIPYSASVIDIGSGAGVPGLVIAIARPDCKVTLMDSQAKKVAFILKVAQELKLSNVTALHQRAEEVGVLRGTYDIGTARAVANLPILIEYIIPYLKVGGRMIAYKSECDKEIASAVNALKELGSTIEETRRFVLDNTYKRCLIVVKKLEKTATKYPRNVGKAKASPL